jgi:ribonucleoside-diphosphate reductase alpha chain
MSHHLRESDRSKYDVAQYRAGVNVREPEERPAGAAAGGAPAPRAAAGSGVAAAGAGQAAGAGASEAKPRANEFAAIQNQEDAPPCSTCGSIMIRSGACYKCANCGTTSGCA